MWFDFTREISLKNIFYFAFFWFDKICEIGYVSFEGGSAHDDKKSRYAYVNIEFKCGCEFDYGMIQKLALDLKKQLGWEITTSTGLSGYAGKYTIKVLRSSIKNI